MEHDEIERNLPGYENDRSHYDWDALGRLRHYKTQRGKMQADGYRFKHEIFPGITRDETLEDISGHIEDFCVQWTQWTPGAEKGKFDRVNLPYTKKPPEGSKLAATLKIKTPELEFQTMINEQSTRKFMAYLRELDDAGLNVKDIFTKITTSKVRSSYSMTFQQTNPSGVME